MKMYPYWYAIATNRSLRLQPGESRKPLGNPNDQVGQFAFYEGCISCDVVASEWNGLTA